MTKSDAHLKRMVARLAGMTNNDRAFVLDRLGPDARAKLAPLVTVGERPATVSTGLQVLMQEVANGQSPKTMTVKAITALRSLHREAPDPVTKSLPQLDGLAGRVSAFMRRGTR